MSVVYSARTADEFAYGDELRALAKTRRIQLWQTVTREPAEAWTGRRGRIALHHLEEMVQDPETLCFVCGPHALVEDVPRLLQQAGVAAGRIRTEDWGGEGHAADRVAARGNTPRLCAAVGLLD